MSNIGTGLFWDGMADGDGDGSLPTLDAFYQDVQGAALSEVHASVANPGVHRHGQLAADTFGDKPPYVHVSVFDPTGAGPLEQDGSEAMQQRPMGGY